MSVSLPCFSPSPSFLNIALDFFNSLARIFHTLRREAPGEVDETRRAKNCDDGCMQPYRLRSNASPTQYGLARSRSSRPSGFPSESLPDRFQAGPCSSASNKPQQEEYEIFGLELSMIAAQKPMAVLEPTLEETPDTILVAQTQNGDSKAFDELIRKYHSRLYGLIYHMTSNHEDTNDLLQEVFSKAYRSINSFQGKSRFYTWIYRIAVNMTLNFIKKQRRQRYASIDDTEHPIENDPEFIAATSNGSSKDPAALMNNQELQKKLTTAMLQLSSQHRAVVTLFDIQGIPQSEIAKILKTTEGTVRSRLFYAHRQLQNYLQEFMLK